jgi:putative salt-induced outer membrane protein YdiY
MRLRTRLEMLPPVWIKIGLLIALGWSAGTVRATPVVAVLRNGDRISGELIAQATNHVVIATGWAGTLSLPLSALGGLQTTAGDKLIPAATIPAPTVPASQSLVASAPPKAVAGKAAAPPPAARAPAKRLHSNLQLGSNLNFGARDQRLIYGRLKMTHAMPYEKSPKKFFRTIGDVSADYGETEAIRSANRVNGSVKTDFDVGEQTYFYNVASGGFDEIRKIDLQYAAGPGVGYHLLKRPTLELDLEGGVDYQVQNRSTGEDTSSAYLRLSDNITWKLGPRLSLSKKLEYFVDAEDPEQFRFRIDSTVSFKLVENLSLNLSLLDSFDTDPAPKINRNELQIRSTVGITF